MVKKPMGIPFNVLVMVDKFIFLDKFVVFDYKVDFEMYIILGDYFQLRV